MNENEIQKQNNATKAKQNTASFFSAFFFENLILPYQPFLFPFSKLKLFILPI
jgi:hypothetical protein